MPTPEETARAEQLQRQEAEQQRQEAEQQRQEAEQQRQEAEQQRQEAEALLAQYRARFGELPEPPAEI